MFFYLNPKVTNEGLKTDKTRTNQFLGSKIGGKKDPKTCLKIIKKSTSLPILKYRFFVCNYIKHSIKSELFLLLI